MGDTGDAGTRQREVTELQPEAVSLLSPECLVYGDADKEDQWF